MSFDGYDEARAPHYKLIEKVDGQWTDLITAGVPWMRDEQIARNRKRRIFYSEQAAITYRNKLRKQEREVQLIRYRGMEVINK